jgi:membrane protease YdiL (CAAX protease family)
MGAALAISWLKAKKNLWVVILVHAYMDFILMMQIYLA